MLERYVDRFLQTPHSSVHKVIAMILIARASEESQHLGDVYFAVRDWADRLDPSTEYQIAKSEWEIWRDATVVKTGITEAEFESLNPRPSYWD